MKWAIALAAGAAVGYAANRFMTTVQGQKLGLAGKPLIPGLVNQDQAVVYAAAAAAAFAGYKLA